MQTKRNLNALRKRAGSLSNEKIHNIEIDMIKKQEEENHLKKLAKTTTRAIAIGGVGGINGETKGIVGTNQNNHNELNIEGRENRDNIITNDNSKEEKGYSNNNKNNNKSKKSTKSSNELSGKKSSPVNGWVMLPETKKLLNDLDFLNLDEKRIAMVINEDAFIDRVKQEIDCVGCSLRLQSYLRELAELAKSKGKILNFEGFLILPEAKITIAENHLENTIGIAQLLQYHKSRSFLLENLNKNLNIKKKNDGYMHKTRVHHRCFLHSKKPMPNSVWREALQNLIENHLSDIAALTEIDEATYVLNLQNHFKKRKFCFTCKENIICAYENMIEEASKYSDVGDEEIIDDDDTGEISETQEGQQLTTNYNQLGYSSSSGTNLMNIEHDDGGQDLDEGELYDNNDMVMKPDNIQHISGKIMHQSNGNYDACNENENEGHYEEEKGVCETNSNNVNTSLMSYIRFCPERRKIIIPLEMETFTEFLSKAEVDIGMQAKHAVTREAAQEELLICLGYTLKEKLQALWRYKKSEEMIKLLFLKVVRYQLYT